MKKNRIKRDHGRKHHCFFLFFPFFLPFNFWHGFPAPFRIVEKARELDNSACHVSVWDARGRGWVEGTVGSRREISWSVKTRNNGKHKLAAGFFLYEKQKYMNISNQVPYKYMNDSTKWTTMWSNWLINQKLHQSRSLIASTKFCMRLCVCVHDIYIDMHGHINRQVPHMHIFKIIYMPRISFYCIHWLRLAKII